MTHDVVKCVSMCLLDQKLTTVSNKAIPLVAVEQSKAVVVVSFLDCTSVDLILFYFILLQAAISIDVR